jgi:octaheme c-type cytochrome (tetrathionate reductase family)
MVAGRDEPISTGKKNTINNFCIGIQSNWPGCTSCHAGYGWEDANFDFDNEENVDCLVCHDQSGTYVKSSAGQPAEGVDLLAVAQTVGTPTRENCGGCHFRGGGGDAVKHGDLDSTLYFPPESVDVHMGRYDFLCVDCHQTTDHVITGRAISVSVDNANQIYCTDCHDDAAHTDERLNAHTDTVACQTCHIPQGATREPTKTHWDWSTAGDADREEDAHEYLKIKGSFVYEDNFIPEYYWYDGLNDRYLMGDVFDPSQPMALNHPTGSIDNPNAKIWPFKVHRAEQPYDTVYNYLLQPKTVGEGGFWTDFDWNQALELGSEVVGLPYSGDYGFASTEMFWPITHMVTPKEDALQCSQCHSETGRLDWEALGYPGDPMDWGSRLLAPSVSER